MLRFKAILDVLQPNLGDPQNYYNYVIVFCREQLETPDGGMISLDWLDNEDEIGLYPDPGKRPTLVILPGLTGM